MPNYRRSNEGQTYFFTVVTYQRNPFLCHEKCRQVLRSAIKETQIFLPFKIDAWILMPDHIHTIWTLPLGDTDYSKRWGLIKKSFTKQITNYLDIPESTKSRVSKRESTIWQRRFWEHTILDDKDYEAHCNYIHYNPVKHGLVSSPVNWLYSTFHQFVREGIYPADWGSGDIVFDDTIGSE